MINNDLIIRKACPEDITLIYKLTLELAEYEKLLDKVEATEESFRKYLFEEKTAEVLIAEYKNEPAAQALFFNNFSTFVGRPGIYLEDLYVRPQFRGKGIGKALLLYIINLAKERNYGRVEWSVLNWNTPAIEFYKKIGAVQMDEWSTFRLSL